MALIQLRQIASNLPSVCFAPRFARHSIPGGRLTPSGLAVRHKILHRRFAPPKYVQSGYARLDVCFIVGPSIPLRGIDGPPIHSLRYAQPFIRGLRPLIHGFASLHHVLVGRLKIVGFAHYFEPSSRVIFPVLNGCFAAQNTLSKNRATKPRRGLVALLLYRATIRPSAE